MKRKITLLLVAGLLLRFPSGAASFAQTITLSEHGASLEMVLRTIKKQTGYQLFYNADLLRKARPVTVEVHNGSLDQALQQCFTDQPLTYSLVHHTIVVRERAAPPVPRAVVAPPLQIVGQVTDENGEPLAGVTVRVKAASALTPSTATDANGHYNLTVPDETVTLIYSYVGYESQEVPLAGRTTVAVRLRLGASKLDDVVVVAYGTTTQRENTGSVATIDAKTIIQQPVSNPIEALQGRMAGVLVTPASGFGGSTMNVQVRGQNSLLGGNQPLYVVDGVPYASGGLNSFAAFGAFAPQASYDSPLNSINPADIASIDVLKDADATAIYGSRGANGVVLITTKQGKAGKGKLDVNVYSGAGQVTRKVDLLNTEQYLALRREAFRNDGLVPDAGSAPDLTTFSQTAYTDWQKKLIGGTARVSDAQAAYTAGTAQTHISLSGGYHYQGTTYPGDFGSTRFNGRIAINQASANGKLQLDASAAYVNTVNKQSARDFTILVTLPPNYEPYNADGSFNFVAGVTNPEALMQQGIINTSRNLLSNLAVSYKVLPGLTAKLSGGLNRLTLDQFGPQPTSSINPFDGPVRAAANFANGANTTYLVEPQLGYSAHLLGGEVQALAGGTFQQTTSDRLYVYATDYISDAVLENLTAASTKTYYASDAFTYRYESVFGRLNYNYKGKYILNGTFRRDGSSKFGPDQRFGNFGAGGAAWLFSEEQLLKNSMPWLSYGKLRGSYGITGSDQGTTGYYDYLATYSSTGFRSYGAQLGLAPVGLGNPDFSWESVKKLDLAIELGFLKDRILLVADYYRSISDRQLVGYTVPTQTGFSSITANFPAVVLNRGFEFSLNTTNVQTGRFTWRSAATLTVPHNELRAFPDLESSFYAYQFALGQATTVSRGYPYAGIDPATGLATGGYVSPTGSFNSDPNGATVVLATGYPKFYGGLQNSFAYKGFNLDFFLQFTKQTARNYVPDSPPGQGLSNATTDALRRWQNPGDVTDIPRATASFDVPFLTYYNYSSSPSAFSDASFLRLKTLSLGYTVPAATVASLHLQGLRFYIQGQNLVTLTKYRGFDPEVPGLVLPPMRVLTGGLQVTL